MQVKSWGWAVLAVGLAGCGLEPEGAEGVAPGEELGTVQQAEAPGSAVTRDGDGNVITAVHFTGSVDLGTRDPDVPGVVLTKYSADGRLVWTRVLRGREGGLLSVDAVRTDREGNVLVAGWSEAGAELAQGVGVEGAFLAKLDRHGALRWVRGIPSAAALSLDVSVTPEGQGALVESFGGPTDSSG